MQTLEYFKLQSKNLLDDFDSDHPKYFPNAKFWVSKYIKDADKFSLMKAQHVVANIAGFTSWENLSKAPDQEMAVAKDIFDNRDAILAKLDHIFGHQIPDYRIVSIDGRYARNVSNWHKDGYEVSGESYHSGIFNVLTAQTLKEIYAAIGGSYAEYDPTSVWCIAQMTSRVILVKESSAVYGDWRTDSSVYNQMNIPYQTVVIRLWENRKNFRDYLNQMLDFFKKNPVVVKFEGIHWDAQGQISNDR
ncbi:MAG: hypothetical protein FWC51_04020 [Proteobacteria bacterium]|nr:hypothetical protein [Pseudomonadota bacterium]